jgi:hypothetical protein
MMGAERIGPAFQLDPGSIPVVDRQMWREGLRRGYREWQSGVERNCCAL